MSPTIRSTIRCDGHGQRPWEGEVICTACDRVWKLAGDDVDAPPASFGPLCVCGSFLTGKLGGARAICPDCYAERRGKQPSA